MATFELSELEPTVFEHIVNALALEVLGQGATGFGPGADGGRDGYFEGEAPYPSLTDRWKGVWYIQSRFHKPNPSHEPQSWLLEKIKEELDEFKKPNTQRRWPDNWIVATNIDQSGVPQTGAFDRARELVRSARPQLESRFHIWGGSKIIDFLHANRSVSERYAHFLTPGNVLSALMAQLSDDRADVDAILQYLVVRQLKDQRLTKLDQAGSQADARPAIHHLFVDLPFRNAEHGLDGDVMSCLVSAANETHRPSIPGNNGPDWRKWAKHPRRARGWFIRMLSQRRWAFIIDGLDEVPQDVKERVALQVAVFINDVAVEQECDLFSLCTSRPQGYSGQFRGIECAGIELLPLPIDRATLRSPEFSPVVPERSGAIEAEAPMPLRWLLTLIPIQFALRAPASARLELRIITWDSQWQLQSLRSRTGSSLPVLRLVHLARATVRSSSIPP
jgi:hypothetical protein